MGNNLTKKDILNSMEFKWRRNQIILMALIWLLAIILFLFVPFGLFYDDLNEGFKIWGICVLASGIIFGLPVIYNIIQQIYLLKNYQKFSLQKTILDNVATSYSYRSSIYYIVTVNVDGKDTKTYTNPMFSSRIFQGYSPEEYTNKRVLGLYNESFDKFYLIKKID